MCVCACACLERERESALAHHRKWTYWVVRCLPCHKSSLKRCSILYFGVFTLQSNSLTRAHCVLCVWFWKDGNWSCWCMWFTELKLGVAVPTLSQMSVLTRRNPRRPVIGSDQRLVKDSSDLNPARSGHRLSHVCDLVRSVTCACAGVCC